MPAVRSRHTGTVITSRLAAAALLLAVVSPPLARPAAAQTIDASSELAPTRGVFLPGAAVAGSADATAVESNPGQLGLVEMTSTALVANAWNKHLAQEGRGLGLLFASPLIVSNLVIGAGFEWLRPSAEGTPESYRKLVLGGGLRLGAGLGLGATWEHLFQSRFAGMDSMSAGLGWRPSAYLALGAVGRDLTRPRLPGVPGARLPREWDAEVALRPIGTPRLELAGGLRVLDGAGDARLGPHGRLLLGLVPGLTLLADFDVPRTRITTTSLEGVQRTRTDWRASVGLIVSLDRTSLTAVAVGGYRRYDGSNDGASGPGASLVLKQFFNRQPALLSFPYVARVKLAGMEGDRSFLQTVFGLRRLADDPAVGAVLLQIEGLDLGYGRIEELRAEVLSIARRKPVFAWISQPDTRQYYLASAATKVAFHPAGSLFFGGLSQTVTFFKTALDQLGVAVDLVRIAEYKGAMEPFVLPQQSVPVRENRDALIDDLHGRLVAGVVAGRAGRGLGADRVQRLIDKALFTPAEAKDAGLVDEIVDDRNLEKWVQGNLGRRWGLRSADFGRRESGRWRASRVALILIDGAIADGKPQGIPAVQGTVAWSDPIIDALDAVRRDPSVRAVVLRVNSPGGSAFASDRIARQISKLREAGKPVMVSMGDTAASGGYYVAAPGDTILASPSVVTGSIGIYAYKLDVGHLMGRLSINAETISRGARADMFSLYRPWNQEEKTALQSRLDYFYKQFLRVVADGRKAQGITLDRAHQLGKGRVYTGAQALGHRLVDRLGTVADAVDEAARRGKVPVGAGGLPEMVVLPNAPNDPLETLLALRRLVEVRGEADGPAVPAPAAIDLPGFIARHGRAAARLLLPLYAGNSTGIEARLPYEITFE
jgi:protease-4